jgi:hypothetical protein
MPTTDSTVTDLNGVRRAIRDELIRRGRALRNRSPRSDTDYPLDGSVDRLTRAYATLGGDLEQGPTDAQRALEQERDQAVIQGRRMADAIDALIATTQQLGLDYFEGEAYADFRAAIEALRDSSPRMTPIRVHG